MALLRKENCSINGILALYFIRKIFKKPARINVTPPLKNQNAGSSGVLKNTKVPGSCNNPAATRVFVLIRSIFFNFIDVIILANIFKYIYT